MSNKQENHVIHERDDKHIAVISCGRQISESGHSVPPRVYPSFSFTFVLRGRGTYVTRYGRHRVTAGSGFLIEAGSTVSYSADEAEPWEYIFVTFHGDGCRKLLSTAGLSEEKPVFQFSTDERTLGNLNELLRVCREDRAAGYDALGYFLIIASGIISGAEPRPARDSRSRCLREAVGYIEANYDRNISVSELSERLFIDRSGVYRMFMEEFGVSPKRYILRYRLSRAAKQLRETDVSVTDAALNAGFFDRSHFNKAFRAFYGVTPTEFREKTP